LPRPRRAGRSPHREPTSTTTRGRHRMATPAERGLRIPAESAPHDRCLMAWPTMRRVDFWRGHLGAARDCYAIVARAINEVEPIEAPFVLEGSAFTIVGAGTLVAIESNVLDRARNPGLTRPEMEANLRDHLGVDRVIWLAGGLLHDVYGDVGNVLSFIEPGRV